MALSIPDYPDPQDVPGVTIPAVYAWIADLDISYSGDRAAFDLWVHQSEGAAGSWPGGARIEPIARLRVACGDPVPGHPDATFPAFAEVEARAATIAEAWHAAAATDEGRSAVRAATAKGAAIRAALYRYLRELVFPGAVEVD
jgi:hypothetical protein